MAQPLNMSPASMTAAWRKRKHPSQLARVAQVFGNDPERVFVLLVNLSANTIYVSFDTNVSSTNGILLAANGGSLEMDVRSDLIFPIRAIYALAAGAGSMLYVLTMRRDFAPPPPVE